MEDQMTKTKKEAMDQAEINASLAWKAAAMAAIRDLAENNQEFVADDVWGRLNRKDAPTPHEKRALGPMMRNACISGFISPTGRHQQSRQPLNHQRPVAVWESQLYRSTSVPTAKKRGGFISWVKAIFTGRDRVTA